MLFERDWLEIFIINISICTLVLVAKYPWRLLRLYECLFVFIAYTCMVRLVQGPNRVRERQTSFRFNSLFIP